jgi:glycerol-3-phosphate acyltransferase PlsY
MLQAAVMIFAYLLGSVPTALIFSQKFQNVDIRTVGDGNMGATNIAMALGTKYGFIVGFIDILKGALPVLLAKLIGLTIGWQFVVGICAILGHDFPIFARFKGGQGTATSVGTMFVLFPIQTSVGFIVYIILLAIIKKSPISAGIGGGIIAILLGVAIEWILLAYCVGVFIFIPIKAFLDSSRRKQIEALKLKHL